MFFLLLIPCALYRWGICIFGDFNFAGVKGRAVHASIVARGEDDSSTNSEGVLKEDASHLRTVSICAWLTNFLRTFPNS